MNPKVIPVLFMSLVFTGIGLLCGWYGASRAYSGSAAGQEGAEDAAAESAAPALSEEALKNMGVATAEAALTPFSRYQPVSATVAATPYFRQAVYAPVAGRISSLDADFGAMARKGDVLATLIRDPMPRAQLILTEDVLKPVSETLHETMARLRSVSISVEILDKELARLTSFSNAEDGTPLLPKKEIITAEYDLLKAERELSIIQHELERHGLSEEQIRNVEDGEFPPVDVKVWLGALKHNGIWTPLAQKIYEALPHEVQQYYWTVSTIGELVAGNLAEQELLDWILEEQEVGNHFLEIGGLLQRGHNLADVRDLHDLGALESIVRIRAPATAVDWDVQAIHAKPGKYVAQGEPLFTLENPRALYLRVEPTASEVALMMGAVEKGQSLEARPLVRGTAPDLQALMVERVFNKEDGSGTAALVSLVNRSHITREGAGGRVYRSWDLREGLRYELRVPIDTYGQAYVFPTDAVVDDGMDKVIFLRSGDSFQKIPVVVLYQDHEVVVLPATADIFPGNPIVISGTFALSLAYKQQGQGEDGGHGHAHGPGCSH